MYIEIWPVDSGKISICVQRLGFVTQLHAHYNLGLTYGGNDLRERLSDPRNGNENPDNGEHSSERVHGVLKLMTILRL